jgi:hypothetical protein
MSGWDDLPYGWAVIALGVVLLVISGTIIVVPLEHGREVRYATPADQQSGEPPGMHDVSDLPPECQTILRRLAAGENVSREFYATRLGETTYVVHNTDFSERPVEAGPGRWQIEENYTGWTRGGRLTDWQLQEDYCAGLVRIGEYRLDGDRYSVSGRGRITSIYAFHRAGVVFVFVVGMVLIAVGQNLRGGRRRVRR